MLSLSSFWQLSEQASSTFEAFCDHTLPQVFPTVSSKLKAPHILHNVWIQAICTFGADAIGFMLLQVICERLACPRIHQHSTRRRPTIWV